MNNKLKAFLSIPKSIWANLRYLPLKQAYKMPILIAYNASLKSHSGGLILTGEQRFGDIRIGFHEVTVASKDKTLLRIDGSLEIKGRAFIGRSSKIYIQKGASVVIGDGFMISASSSIMCCKQMKFGKNVLFSWDCLVMDSDTHTIIYDDGKKSIMEKPVSLGDNVWVGCRSLILKGSFIPSNTVIGAGTKITGQSFEENSIIAGYPPKSIKKITKWIHPIVANN